MRIPLEINAGFGTMCIVPLRRVVCAKAPFTALRVVTNLQSQIKVMAEQARARSQIGFILSLLNHSLSLIKILEISEKFQMTDKTVLYFIDMYVINNYLVASLICLNLCKHNRS